MLCREDQHSAARIENNQRVTSADQNPGGSASAELARSFSALPKRTDMPAKRVEGKDFRILVADHVVSAA
jgi:hypothetical protein